MLLFQSSLQIMLFSFCLSIIYFINRKYFLNQGYKGNHFFFVAENRVCSADENRKINMF